MEKVIYTNFDHNATTQPSPQCLQNISLWLEQWGNPSSIHYLGRGPKTLLRESRRQIADFLGADPLEIIFTSGGSEANNLALQGVFAAIRAGRLFSGENRNQLIISAVEHPSITKTAMFLKQQGIDVTLIPVSRGGHLDLETFEKALSTKTALVSMMFANNETGNIFPIAKMAKMAHAVGALMHCDGVQALGKAEVHVKNWQVDLATFSAHKFYALKGCGILYARRGVVLEPLIHGGGQERRRRAGTENLLSIASFAAQTEQKNLVTQKIQHMQQLRDELEAKILREIPGVKKTGGEAPRICNTSSLVIDGIDGETLLMNLDMKGFAVSTGAACSSGSPEPSPVLLSMGLSRQEAQASLRLSLGWSTTADDVLRFVEALKQVVQRLRSFQHGEAATYGL